MKDKLLEVKETVIGKDLTSKQAEMLIKRVQTIFSTESEWLEFNGIPKSEIFIEPLNTEKRYDKILMDFKENNLNPLDYFKKLWNLSKDLGLGTEEQLKKVTTIVDLSVSLEKSGKMKKVLKEDIEEDFLKGMKFTSDELIEFYWAARINLEVEDKVLKTHIGMNLKDSVLDDWIFSVQWYTDIKEIWIGLNSKTKFTVKQLEKFYKAVRISYP